MCNHVMEFFGIVVKWNVNECMCTVITTFGSFSGKRYKKEREKKRSWTVNRSLAVEALEIHLVTSSKNIYHKGIWFQGFEFLRIAMLKHFYWFIFLRICACNVNIFLKKWNYASALSVIWWFEGTTHLQRDKAHWWLNQVHSNRIMPIFRRYYPRLVWHSLTPD